MSRLSDRLAKMEAQHQARQPVRRQHLVILFDDETEDEAYLYGDWFPRSYPITDCIFVPVKDWIPRHIALEIEVGTPPDEAPAEVARILAERRQRRIDRRSRAEQSQSQGAKP